MGDRRATPRNQAGVVRDDRAVTRPRLLLVTEFTELQWQIKPLLEDWADVIARDLPGIGEEPLPAGIDDVAELTREMVAERGLEEIDRASWDRCFLVSDGWGIANAVHIATRRPEMVAGMSLGHACLSLSRSGPRPPISPEVYETFTQLIKTDAPAFIQHAIAQLTQGGIDEQLAQKIVQRVSPEFITEGWAALTEEEDFAQSLGAFDCPMLLAKHEGCLINTDEGFQDAVTALPEAEIAAFDDPPSASSAFAERLRGFCEAHW
jgi:pimeloyl-ACP methyl ester carboxylesterase